MKKSLKIILIVLAALVIGGVVCCFVLCSKGLLGFYHPRKKAQPGQVKVACVGDSVTYGFGINGWAKNNYPAQLQELLGEGFCVNNFGYSGRTAQTTGDRPYSAEKLYKQSMEFEPDIVVFMLGSNDSKAFNWDKENFIKDYKALVETYVNMHASPTVIVMAPPPVFEVGGKVKYNIEKQTIAEEIVPLIKEIAASSGLECIDLYAMFDGKSELFSDGCHPTAEGAGLIANAVLTQISRQMAAK